MFVLKQKKPKETVYDCITHQCFILQTIMNKLKHCSNIKCVLFSENYDNHNKTEIRLWSILSKTAGTIIIGVFCVTLDNILSVR